MLFNSSAFVCLYLITLALYFMWPKVRWQIGVLVVSSLAFYGWSDPYLLILLLASIFWNALSSFQVARSTGRMRFWWAVAGVVLNLGTLIYFKYAGLLLSSLLAHSSNNDRLWAFVTSIPLPIGISFFTFQGISLVVDVYKKSESIPMTSFVRHLYNTAFFKSFFPQLISGPIVKAHDFYYQIRERRVRDIDWEQVFKLLVLGYFLKNVVADNIKEQTYWIAYPYFLGLSSVDLLAMLFGYSIQIFADFAGYSIIAMGLALSFGYRLPENFNWPYISLSFSEFWRRWHISLSSFLREYLYIPLGGNRVGSGRTYFNLMIVMILGGLWHGAAWSYAIWGFAHGAALAIERAIGGLSRSRALNMLLVFCYVSAAWLLFKLPEFSHVVQYVKTIFSNWSVAPGKMKIFLIFIYSIPVVVAHILAWGREQRRWNISSAWSVFGFAVMLFLLLVNSGFSGEFIYFQF